MRPALFIMIVCSIIFNQTNAQTKKAIYRDIDLYVERENAGTFDYEDQDIKFVTKPSFTNWSIIIENKTKQNMKIYWQKGTFVVNKISGSILFYSYKTFNEYLPPYIETIAPESQTPKNYITHSNITFILDNRIIKKSGTDYYIVLTIPIEVNGELKNYTFKYKVYFIKEKKQKKICY